MAPTSNASASLVEAYLGRSDVADVESYLGARSVASSSRFAAVPSRAASALSRQQDDRSGRTPRSARLSACSILSRQSCAPEPKTPHRSVSSDGGAVKALKEKQLEESLREVAKRLRDTGAPQAPSHLSQASGKEADDAASELDCAASLRSGSQGCRECQSFLSHATTPSWRSRSFPPHVLKKLAVESSSQVSHSRCGHEASSDKAQVQERRRLPSLPDEARRSSPPSEVALLGDIASEVNEANALLVESFLNVKRRTMPEDLDVPFSDAAPRAPSSSKPPGGSGGSKSGVSASRHLRRPRLQERELLSPLRESLLGEAECH